MEEQINLEGNDPEKLTLEKKDIEELSEEETPEESEVVTPESPVINKEEEFDFSKLKFSFDLSKANYQLDELQNQLLQFYLHADKKFRRAFSMNYTVSLLKYIRDKAKLHEPVSISVIGAVRSGKSYSSITLCIFHQAQYGRLFTSEYICANVYEFLEKVQKMPKEKLVDHIFLVDEMKQSVFSVGSTAKKMKVSDIANIIAINNISTIYLTPHKWAAAEASDYGLRLFGRCFETKTCRMMLYNLQEGGKGGTLPLGNVYLPIFTSFLPQSYAKELEDAYLKRKNQWVDAERRGEGDVLSLLKRKAAEQFLKDDQFRGIKKKAQRFVYIQQRLGSEYTHGECEQILEIADMLKEGISFSS